MEKKTEMNRSIIARKLSEMKAIPVVIPGGNIIIRSDSKNAEEVLSKLNVPEPLRVVGDTLTKKQ